MDKSASATMRNCHPRGFKCQLDKGCKILDSAEYLCVTFFETFGNGRNGGIKAKSLQNICFMSFQEKM